MWKKYCRAGHDTDDNRRMRIACWILKATNTHSEYVTHCFSAATTVARTPLYVTLHVHCHFHCDSPKTRVEFQFFLATNKVRLSVCHINTCTLQHTTHMNKTKLYHTTHTAVKYSLFFYYYILRLSHGHLNIWHALLLFMCL